MPELTAVDLLALEAAVVEALRECYDPELPVDIYELGLVYGVKVEPSGKVEVVMTLTAPNCPAASYLPEEVGARLDLVPGVTEATVRVVWDPPWTPDRSSDAAKLALGLL